ncbi:hypothetical protein OCGS_0701 [Oceaniovalibus guishaninsula JLT2003]|uniref:PAS domain-containing protein n=1 Tax=Oceaniovalibus guishaninsula JLT2003 TaxID=1231392 RepID=K2HCU1_9RHOB|nr:PAS domain-containing protein [Oceaniovalibus guishaninsula]EKE45223.1 hypothetical protein OCGS_0701 [Oceaniovalibus guishaninsula JLT2003]
MNIGSDTVAGAGHVVSLVDGHLAPTGDPLALLSRFWQARCDGRIMPQRADMDPRGIAAILDRVFMVERIAPGVCRLRLGGAHLADLMGMDVRGMPLSAFFVPDARAALADAVEAVFAEPARIELTLTGPRAGLFGRVKGRLLMLPLRGRDGAVVSAIGCLDSDAAPGRAPQRFTISAQDRRTLIGYGDRDEAESTDGDPFAEADAARAVARRRASLHLVHSA